MIKRLLSGIVMIILFIIFYLLGGIYFVSLMGLLSILAYKEIIMLKKYPPLVMVIGLICMIGLVLANSMQFNYLLGSKYPSVLLCVVLLIIPSLIPKLQKQYTMEDAFTLIGMIFFIGLAFSSINENMLSNRHEFLYLILITTLNDTFAYLTGVTMGKHKFSRISPKKTLEGLAGGLIAGTIGGFIIHLILLPNTINIFSLLVMTIILNISCQLGDLLFSKIKRENNIKDFSNTIPGHGGILDRLDSILFTSLVFLLIKGIF